AGHLLPPLLRLQKRPVLKLLERLPKLILRVHHDRAVPRHREGRYFARTSGVSTACSATNQTWDSLVRMIELTMRSFVPSSPRSADRRAIVRASLSTIWCACMRRDTC